MNNTIINKLFLFDVRQIKIYNNTKILNLEMTSMQQKVIVEKQDLTYLKWSHARNSSGTAGTFLKSQSVVSGEKIYYKLSGFDSEKGIVGHECVNEIIVDRLLTILGVEHLEYQLEIYQCDGVNYRLILSGTSGNINKTFDKALQDAIKIVLIFSKDNKLFCKN